VNVIPSSIPDVVFIEPRVFPDARGSFRTTFRVDEYAAAGLVKEFKQDNVSVSRRGVLRGLHFQNPNGQAKLVYALRGSIFDVAVDVRRNSPTFGRAVWTTLSSENHRQILIPAGFAHGFYVETDEAVVAYKCSELYAPQSERTIQWNDPALEIPWPSAAPILSDRDAAAPSLKDFPRDLLP
jgi:dTDP-4-dehydrorhamnose 3,5-epimerase